MQQGQQITKRSSALAREVIPVAKKVKGTAGSRRSHNLARASSILEIIRQSLTGKDGDR